MTAYKNAAAEVHLSKIKGAKKQSKIFLETKHYNDFHKKLVF